VLNWCESAGVEIAAWPVLKAYRSRLRQWPSIARAMQAERPLLEAA
jgi:glutathione S-transferase